MDEKRLDVDNKLVAAQLAQDLARLLYERPPCNKPANEIHFDEAVALIFDSLDTTYSPLTARIAELEGEVERLEQIAVVRDVALANATKDDTVTVTSTGGDVEYVHVEWPPCARCATLSTRFAAMEKAAGDVVEHAIARRTGREFAYTITKDRYQSLKSALPEKGAKE